MRCSTSKVLSVLRALLLFSSIGLLPAAAGASTPVRCRVYINTSLTNMNVPMECTKPDGSTFVNVPAGHYVYVTDIIVKRRLTSQTTVAASVRIWEEFGSSQGCDPGGTGVTGQFVTDQYLVLADTSIEGQLHASYRVPYLVLTEDDCLAVYTATASGLVVELSGLLSTSPSFGLLELPEPSSLASLACPAAAIALLARLRLRPS